MLKRSTPLQRHTPLKRTSPLRSRPKSRVKGQAEAEWTTPRYGKCAVCGAKGLILRHHILTKQRIKQAYRDDLLWDQRNALDVGAPETCSCHGSHHAALRDGQPFRIPLRLVSVAATEMAVEVLGEDATLEYFLKFYAIQRAVVTVRSGSVAA